MANLGRGQGFRNVKRWYTRIATLERCICLLQLDDGRPLGTGFLVAPDIVLTAGHVVAQAKRHSPHMPRIRFDYAEDQNTGQVFEGTLISLASDSEIASSPVEELDISLLRLARQVGEEELDGGKTRGWVDLGTANVSPETDSFLALFQHADGGPLVIAMHSESVAGFSHHGRRLLHRTDTSPGASGGPCFDIDWRPLAMHQGFSFDHGNHNLAVPFSAIVPWLKERDLWSLLDRRAPQIRMPSEQRSPEVTPFQMDRTLRQAIFAKGESQRLELKERAVILDGGKAKLLRKIVHTVAAFMNSRGGGSVVIGVTDDRRIIGIADQYAQVNRQASNWDGFDLWLRSILSEELDGPAAQQFFFTARYNEKGKEICVVHVEPAKSPVFVDKQFYVRFGPRTQCIHGHDMLAYVSNRWSVFGGARSPLEAEADGDT